LSTLIWSTRRLTVKVAQTIAFVATPGTTIGRERIGSADAVAEALREAKAVASG
jgi:hypothetical protein